MKQQAIDILDEMIKDIEKLYPIDGLLKATSTRWSLESLQEAKSRVQALWDGWTPVTEKLPKIPDNDYLVAVKNKNKEDWIFILDIWVFSSDWVWWKSNTWEDVTHWMPLPLPPVTK